MAADPFEVLLRTVQPRRVIQHMVTPITSSGGAWLTRVRRCDMLAFANSATHYALPTSEGRWMIFVVVTGGRRELVAEKPTKEAAEMWLNHL